MIYSVVMFGMEDPLCEFFSTEQQASKGAVKMARQVYAKCMRGYDFVETKPIESIIHEINLRIPAPGIYYFWGDAK